MDLYNHCLLVIMKNEDIDFECVPHTVKEDIKQLKVTFQKLKDHRDAFDAYHNILSELGEIAWDTLTCSDCEHNLPWPDLIERCEFHEISMDCLITEEKGKKEKADIIAMQCYVERAFIEQNFPHLWCVVKKLEDRNYCDICEELHI